MRNVRKWLGKKLAENDKGLIGRAINWNDDYIVIGVPSSGIQAAKSYAKTMGYEYKQLIMKKEEAGRTFILMNNETRIKACKKKFSYNKEELKDKKVILVDDTIVRGTVMTSLVDNLRDCEVKEIHLNTAKMAHGGFLMFVADLSLIHISEPTRLLSIAYGGVGL